MAEKYQILARKYRPQLFKEVIGQEAIVKTIKNSIRYKRIAHAYLLSGSRGTGKTTLARLFAKALNCKNLKEDIEPCNECQSCKEIASSRSLDVIEIDGASNRGIDDIRQINDTIGYSPTGKYKIYIIDEVHMLTKEAFNALLKTLEEPPENIKFFFATTEAHKVLPTIISRCQRFELKRIPNDLIINKLEGISNDLSREIEKEALHQIANFSEGSLRDAESLLDQIFCYSEGKITLQYITQALGFIDKEYFFELDNNTNQKNLSFAFEFVDKINNSGKDLSYIVEELVEHYKNLLILKLNNSSLSYITESLKNRYLASASYYSEHQLFYILNTITSAITLHKNTFKKIHLETLILKIIKSKDVLPIEILVKRLIDLEASIKSTPDSSDNSQIITETKTSNEIQVPNEIQSINPSKEIENERLVNERQDFQEEEIENEPSPEIEEKIEEEIIKETPTINETPKEQPKEILKKEETKLENNTPSQKDQSRYDTLIRFAQIELDGINKS